MTEIHTPPPDFSSEIAARKARYSQIERESDSIGRVIGVRRLRLSEQTRLTAMTPDLGGVDEVPSQEHPGSTVLVQQRSQYFVVSMVCEIDGAPIPFARNRGELDSILDRLDVEGLVAATTAAGRLFGTDGDEPAIDKAKNL